MKLLLPFEVDRLVGFFTVPGQPVGYVRLVQSGKGRAWSPRSERYQSYCEEIRLEARRQGVPRLEATDPERLFMVVRPIFREQNKTHSDPDNIIKAVLDALFYGAKLGDKHVSAAVLPHLYSPRPSLAVWIYGVAPGWDAMPIDRYQPNLIQEAR